MALKPDRKYTDGTDISFFMNVTAESVNMLMTHDDIIRCSICTRILVLSDQQET